MIRHAVGTSVALFYFVATSPAAVFVDIPVAYAPVPGLPGYYSFTLRVTSTVPGELIQGVDFAGDGSNDFSTGKGFFGTMNQLGPPTLSTVYNDNNNLLPLLNPGHTAAEDSQFLVNSGAANIAHPSGLDEEGPNILQGIWAWTEPQGQSVDFARIVTNDGVSFRGSFALNTPSGIVDSPVFTGCLGVCGPHFDSVAINNVDSSQPGFVEYTWPALADGTFSSQFNAPQPAGVTPATFNAAQRKFHWDTVGAPLGTYKWFISAFNNFGITNRTITVNVTVPEPSWLATLTIAFIASLVCTSVGRNRNF